MNEEYLLQIALELRDEASRNLAATNKEMESLKKEMEATKKQFEAMGREAEKQAEDLKKAFTKIAAASKIALIGLTGLGIGAVKVYADMEEGIKKVETVSSKSFEEIKKSAQDLATTYGMDVKEILEGNYDLVSAMGDIKEAQEVLGQAAQLSKAGFTGFGESINALSSVMNAYKMEATEAAKVSDMLMTVQNNGVVTIGELQSVLSSVVPTAAAMKIEFRDVAAALATMTSNKVPAAQSTTMLKAAFAELAKEGTSASKAFKEVTGISFQEFINQGGNVVEAFDLIQKGAEKSGKSLYDIFGSVEAANAVLNLTGANIDKFKKNLDAMDNSAGTTKKSFDKMAESFNFQMAVLKEKSKEGAIALGEALVPKVKELIDWMNRMNWEEIFSQENIDRTLTMAKTLGTISLAIWGIETAIRAKTAAQIAFNAAAMLNPYILVGMGVGTLAYSALTHDSDNQKALDRLKKENSELENQKELLKIIKSDLERGIADSGMLSTVDGFEKLKEILNSGDIQGALKEIDAIFRRMDNSKPMMAEMLKQQELDMLIPTRNIKKNEDKGLSPGLKKKLEDTLKELEKNINNANSFSDIYFKDDKERFATMQGYYKTALDEMIKNGLTKVPEFEELKKKFFSFGGSIEGFEKSEELKSFITSLNTELESIPTIWKILGVNESGENELKDMEKTLESAIKQAVTKGYTGALPELEKKLQGVRGQLKLFTENREADDNAKKDNEDRLRQLKEDADKQSQAYAQAIKDINSLGDSLYKVGDALENEFLKSLSAVVNSLGALSTSLVGSDGKGGLFGSAGNLASSVGGIPGMESLKGFSNILGVGAASLGVVSALGSMFGGKDNSAKIEAKNQENLRKFDENTNAIRELTNQITANTNTLRGLSNELISNLANNPTINRLLGGENAIDKMQKAMEENRKFSDLTAIEKGSKKTGPWYKKKKVDTFTEIGISDKKLLELAGIKANTIEELSFEQLKLFSKNLEAMDTQFLKSALGKNLTESNIGDLKLQINEYIKQIEMLEKEQANLFKGATLESFKGVQYLDAKQLKQQYIEMYEGMGLDVSEYMDVIDELVAANGILITSMQAVREEIISGTKSFSQAMGSYFSDIIYNASSVLYDTMFSELDSYFTDAFESISDKLVEMKKEGKKITPEELFKDLNFNKILEGDKLQAEMKAQIDEMKEYLKNMGLDLDIIDAIFGEGKVDKLKGYLSSAMSAALDANDFDVFSKSLGQSLYDNVKSGLVAAFSESKLYKSLMEKSMPDFDNALDGAGSFEDAFKIMQDYLNKFEKELEAAGMGISNNIKTEEEKQNQLGNSYYKEAPQKISIVITQEFNGTFVGDSDFRKLARDGAVDAMKEMEENVKGIGVM